jgi:hypothetical protein
MSQRPSIANCRKDGLRDLAERVHYGGDDMEKRRALIFAAGAMNNRKLLGELGSQESANWHEGRRMADPAYVNPYWREMV